MLDYQSIMVTQILSQVVITIVMFTIWRDNRERVPGLNYWMLNLIFQTAGQTLLSVSTRFNSPVWDLIAQTCILTGAVMFFFGLAEFNGTAVRKKRYYLFIALFFTISASITLIFEHETLNTLFFNIAVLIIFISYLKILFHKQVGWYRSIYRSLGYLYIVFSVTYGVRIINLLFSLIKSTEAAVGQDAKTAALLLIASLLLIVVNYIIIILINRSLIQELRQDGVEREELMARLRYLAETDSLTGLANRMTIEEKLLREMVTDKNSKSSCAVILFDLDNFKQTNDTYGHDEGDRVLVKTAAMLQNEFKDTPHTAGRWGGDEFLLIISKERNKEIESIVETILQKIRMIKPDKNYQLSASIGWSLLSEGDSLSSLLKRADINLYKAKTSGKNRACGDLP